MITEINSYDGFIHHEIDLDLQRLKEIVLGAGKKPFTQKELDAEEKQMSEKEKEESEKEKVNPYPGCGCLILLAVIIYIIIESCSS